MKAKQKIMASEDASPRRANARRAFEKRLDELEEKLKESSSSVLEKLVLAELKLAPTDMPTPLTLKNFQVIKEPLFLLLYCEIHAIKQADLQDWHGAPPRILEGLRLNLEGAYASLRHPLNGWQQSMISRVLVTYKTILDGYTLIAPLDAAGLALPFEPAQGAKLLDFVRGPREAARSLIESLDEDFTRKHAGRKAAAVVSGARALMASRFAPQDMWLYKKAAARADGADGHAGGGHTDGGREQGFGGRGRGRGRGRGFGRGRGAKRPRTENEVHHVDDTA